METQAIDGNLMISDILKSDYERTIGAHCYDSLTGLFNHGFLRFVLDHEFKRARRYQTPCSLVLIDIDGFMDYNDQHGHVAGDKVLRDVAGLIRKNIRDADLPARYSGDKFMVLMADTPPSQAMISAARIQKIVEEYFGGFVTVGIGIAGVSPETSTPGEVVRLVRVALSEAKLQGKNHLHVYEETRHSEQTGSAKILVVDDDPINVEILGAILTSQGYEVLKAFNGGDAVRLIERDSPDLILLDVMMPGISGFDVCRKLKSSERTRMIPVVMVTALDDLDSRIKAIEAGADDFITKPPNNLELLTRTKSLIRLKHLNGRLINIESVLFSLANAVEAKDAYTQGHTHRVSALAVNLGKRMALREKDIEALHLGGILHDIGKIGIPDEVLNKPGRLTADEWEIIKTHPEIGYRICEPLKATIGGALEVIRHHHERLDGSGYPDGLKGEAISMVARIMSVVDIYDAIATDRPYRTSMTREEAVAILRESVTGNLLDGNVVENLVDLVLGAPAPGAAPP
jgi:putative two-component system response regulator